MPLQRPIASGLTIIRCNCDACHIMRRNNTD